MIGGHRIGTALAGMAMAALLVMAGVARASAANVSELPTGRDDLAVFALDGRISGGETLQLSALVAKLPPKVKLAIVLNSSGGLLSEGIKLGRFFHSTRIATFVIGYGGGCHSACSLAFLGGRTADGKPSRTLMAGGNLGFHQFQTVRTAEQAQKKFTKADMEGEYRRAHGTISSIIEYLQSIGEDMTKLHLMLQAPNAQIKLLSSEEAFAAGINVMDEKTQQVIESSGIKARVDQQ